MSTLLETVTIALLGLTLFTGRRIMASIQDLRNAFATHIEVLHAEIVEINAKLDELRAANADGGTTEERAALLADIQAATARVQDIIETTGLPGDEQPTEPTDTEQPTEGQTDTEPV